MSIGLLREAQAPTDPKQKEEEGEAECGQAQPAAMSCFQLRQAPSAVQSEEGPWPNGFKLSCGVAALGHKEATVSLKTGR